MGLLDEQLAVDSEAFVDTDGHGEAVTYNPSGGSPLAINATVIRRPPQTVSETFSVLTPSLEIHVRNSATLGIAASAIDKNVDTITVSTKLGGTATVHKIAEVFEQDSGMLVLLVR